eukprot:3966820-Amphidinium_carterae.3
MFPALKAEQGGRLAPSPAPRASCKTEAELGDSSLLDVPAATLNHLAHDTACWHLHIREPLACRLQAVKLR